MLTIDQFRKAGKYADGFFIEKGGIQSPSFDYFGFNQSVGCKTIQVKRFKKEVYPLFLQAVIDGMNRKNNDFRIVVSDCVEVLDFHNDPADGFINGYVSEELREKAIIYILDKIKKDN